MTSVSGTGSATPFTSLMGGSGTATDKTSLKNDDFMQLLVKQMQYQDPSSPMDSAQILQQTSALSSVQTMQSLIDVQQEMFGLQMRLGASSLVGQQVTYTDAKGASQTGTVASASFAGATPTVHVGDQDISLDAVSGIAQAAKGTTTTGA
jgi:flagellar basal-body rod modification protein FlgD